MESIKLWKRGKIIGTGSYARVYLAHRLPAHPDFQSDPSFLMAVKSAEYSSSLRNEIYLLTKFRDCPHIIDFLGYDFTVENDQILLNIFLEYASGGTLRDRINEATFDGHGLVEIEARSYTKSILLGLRCIHSQGYVHCDIKTNNVLLVCGQAKIADLGLTRKADKFLGKFNIGTRVYMAPESIKFGEYGTAADIWSLGCVVFEMLTGKKWRSNKWNELRNILDLSGMSEYAWDFLSKCFFWNPDERWNE